METVFTRQVGIEVPLICGPMYPCSNPELVAAVSEAGGLGIVQPIALTYVHGHDFREGLRRIKARTSKPIGFNALIEGNNKLYRKRMEEWIDISLEEGVRFFLTSLGNPRWVCEKVHAVGGVVYHDVTERKWAQKGVDGGVDGFLRLIRRGYAAVQLGTRFIATTECESSPAYKDAIVAAEERDIVRTMRLTGVPVAVINNAYIQRLGTDAGPFARWMLRGRRTKHWMRTWYALHSVRRLKRSLWSDDTAQDYWQAGRSVAGIHDIRPAGEIVREFAAAL
jgi:nitronate monooxygenase